MKLLVLLSLICGGPSAQADLTLETQFELIKAISRYLDSKGRGDLLSTAKANEALEKLQKEKLVSDLVHRELLSLVKRGEDPELTLPAQDFLHMISRLLGSNHLHLSPEVKSELISLTGSQSSDLVAEMAIQAILKCKTLPETARLPIGKAIRYWKRRGKEKEYLAHTLKTILETKKFEDSTTETTAVPGTPTPECEDKLRI